MVIIVIFVFVIVNIGIMIVEFVGIGVGAELFGISCYFVVLIVAMFVTVFVLCGGFCGV